MQKYVVTGIRCPRCGWVNDKRDAWSNGECKNIYSCVERQRALTTEKIIAIDLLERSERRRALGSRPPRAGVDRPVPDEPQGAGEVAAEEDMARGAVNTERDAQIIEEWRKGWPALGLAKKYGLDRSRIGQITHGIEQGGSGKNRVMYLLQAFPEERMDALNVSRRVGLGKHETTHLLWSLQKQGYVTFKETETNLVGVHLTNAGVAWNNGATEAQAEWVEEQREAIGLPLKEDVPQITLSDPEVLVEAAPEPEPFVEPVVVVPVMPQFVDDMEYPLLNRLLRRRNILTAAANLVDGVGEADLAVEIIARIEKPSPLEAEIISLLEKFPEVAEAIKKR